MTENEIKTNQSQVNLDQVREKLAALVEMWGEKIPSLFVNNPQAGMTEKMLLNTFRPFLPKLQDSLTSKIDSLSDDELLKMIETLEGAFEWLKADA